MILKLKVTLKATEQGKTTVWPAGKEFGRNGAPIPKAIMNEFDIKSGLVEQVPELVPASQPAPLQDTPPPSLEDEKANFLDSVVTVKGESGEVDDSVNPALSLKT